MDNQIVHRTGFMGMFLETFASLNKLNRLMGKTIEIKHEEDWTIIPVTIRTEDTLKVVESGLTVEEYTLCDESEDDFDYSDEWKEREANECF